MFVKSILIVIVLLSTFSLAQNLGQTEIDTLKPECNVHFYLDENFSTELSKFSTDFKLYLRIFKINCLNVTDVYDVDLSDCKINFESTKSTIDGKLNELIMTNNSANKCEDSTRYEFFIY